MVLVRRHRVADIGADRDVIDVQNRDFGDTGIHQFLEAAARDFAVLVDFPGQFVPGLDIDRAGFLVDDVLGDIATDDLVEGHQKIGDLAFVLDLLDLARRDFLARLGKGLAGLGIDQIEGRPRAAHAVGEEGGHPALVLLQLVFDRFIVSIHDAFLVETQRVKQRRHRQLAATVDAGMDDILGVEFEIQPRTAIGNDPAGKEQLAAGMGLALVVIEEHTGRAVHLRHDHAFGAVHDERSVRGHQRHVAHEDVLFLDVLDRLGAGILVDIEHDQTQGDLERRGIGHVALLALFHVVLGLLKLVLHEFEDGGLVEILNRKNRLEDALDAFAVQRLGLVAGVQEKVVRGFLNLDKVRHFQHFADFAEILAVTFLAKIRRCHG